MELTLSTIYRRSGQVPDRPMLLSPYLKRLVASANSAQAGNKKVIPVVSNAGEQRLIEL
jgi:hypothetical protein